MTAPGTTAADTTALREECERLARALIEDVPMQVYVYQGDECDGYTAAAGFPGDQHDQIANAGGPTESAALLALRGALETACDAALERLAGVRGKVVGAPAWREAPPTHEEFLALPVADRSRGARLFLVRNEDGSERACFAEFGMTGTAPDAPGEFLLLDACGDEYCARWYRHHYAPLRPDGTPCAWPTVALAGNRDGAK